MPQTPHLALNITSQIAEIEIDRADKRNSFNTSMWAALEAYCTQISKTPELRVVILRTARPGAFSGGADIAELQIHTRERAEAEANIRQIRAAVEALRNVPCPVIAQIEGPCFGGGNMIALNCDFRVAGPSAKFAIPPARLGLSYSVTDIRHLVAITGLPVARRMLLLAETLDSVAARDCGLVDMLAASDSDVPAEVARMRDRILALSPASLRRIKANLRRVSDGQSHDDTGTLHALLDAFEGEDVREGLAAFLKKRPPSFPGA